MSFLVISLGFLLAVRGSRKTSLQKPLEGVMRAWREASDLFLTVGLVLVLLAVGMAFGNTQAIVRKYEVLGPGLFAYLLSRYQEKTEIFFLTVIAIVFWVISKQDDLFRGLFLAGVVCAGIALFQAGFLGLRYKLLFSRTPNSMNGWPTLCLLAAFLSMILVAAGRWVF